MVRLNRKKNTVLKQNEKQLPVNYDIPFTYCASDNMVHRTKLHTYVYRHAERETNINTWTLQKVNINDKFGQVPTITNLYLQFYHDRFFNY